MGVEQLLWTFSAEQTGPANTMLNYLLILQANSDNTITGKNGQTLYWTNRSCIPAEFILVSVALHDQRYFDPSRMGKQVHFWLKDLPIPMPLMAIEITCTHVCTCRSRKRNELWELSVWTHNTMTLSRAQTQNLTWSLSTQAIWPQNYAQHLARNIIAMTTLPEEKTKTDL